jgi:membrane protein implicated in regulation of membrane protease activity
MQHQQIGIDMTMGTGVVLFVIGAILAFAVRVQSAFFSLNTAGDILMVAGVVVFLIGLVLAFRGRRSTVTTTAAAPADGFATTRSTTRTTDASEL